MALAREVADQRVVRDRAAAVAVVAVEERVHRLGLEGKPRAPQRLWLFWFWFVSGGRRRRWAGATDRDRGGDGGCRQRRRHSNFASSAARRPRPWARQGRQAHTLRAAAVCLRPTTLLEARGARWWNALFRVRSWGRLLRRAVSRDVSFGVRPRRRLTRRARVATTFATAATASASGALRSAADLGEGLEHDWHYITLHL